MVMVAKMAVKMITRVAVVDDNATNLKLMGHIVKQVAGQFPDCFLNPHEAQEALMNNRYDLLLIDHNMPQLTGLEILKNLAEKNCLPQIIALVTAVNEPMIKLTAAELNVTQVIQKPFDLTDFRNFIQEALKAK